MKHRNAVDLDEPLRYVLWASVVLALWGLRAIAVSAGRPSSPTFAGPALDRLLLTSA